MRGIARVVRAARWFKRRLGRVGDYLSLPVTQLSRIAQRRRFNAAYWQSHRAEVQELVVEQFRRDEPFEPEYEQYLRAQISKSLHATRRSLSGSALMRRSENLIDKMDAFLPDDRAELSVLCVGCRTAEEPLHVVRRCRVGEAVGLDLFSHDPLVHVGDMQNMPFQDEQFDVVYACHSLEHAQDIEAALSEAVRVLSKPGLLVAALPVNFSPSATDLWDVESSTAFIDRLPAPPSEILLAEDGEDEIRIVVRINDDSG